MQLGLVVLESEPGRRVDEVGSAVVAVEGLFEEFGPAVFAAEVLFRSALHLRVVVAD